MLFNLDDKQVKNFMNTTNLEYILIKDLFGKDDVELHFQKEVNIYIGENGLGKTTILNCVYYILKKKYEKLLEINFSEIIIKFKTCKPLTINRSDINKFISKRRSRAYYSNEDISYMIDEFIENNNIDLYESNDFIFDRRTENFIRRLSMEYGIPSSVARNYVYDHIRKGHAINNTSRNGNLNNITKLSEALDNNINERVLYFTTYRRIENDFSTLLRKDDPFGDNDRLIRFGMSDVENSIENILKLIRENSRESFNKMTGILLKQYASGDHSENKQMRKPTIDKSMLKIVLDRLGNEVAENDRNKIFDLLNNGEIYNLEYAYLLDLIIKLMENYSKQKIYDDKIKKFSETCNKYLNGKKFVYNQSELKLEIHMEEIVNDKGIKTMELSKLSSGEKQIVSLFSKLYLENEQECILIIDEPELSISMKWQKMLLPDIMRSKNCKMLLTVTHSPFIFDNEFDQDAMDMRNCIKRSDRG